MSIDTCIDTCSDMRMDMHLDVCTDMCTGMCIGIHLDMCLDMCIGMGTSPSSMARLSTSPGAVHANIRFASSMPMHRPIHMPIHRPTGAAAVPADISPPAQKSGCAMQ